MSSTDDLILEKTCLQRNESVCSEIINGETKLTPEEENNSLLKTDFKTVDKVLPIPYYNNATKSNGDKSSSEIVENIQTISKERNLYPNVLVSPSRDHSDIDTDEEDFQLRNFSHHRRNDSGQGSSITDTSINCNDFKKIDLNDDLPDAEISTEENDMLESELVSKQKGKSTNQSVVVGGYSKLPDLDKNVTEVLSKIEEGSAGVLSKTRGSSVLSVKNNLSETALNPELDETDFTDIPLNSPANKGHMNTYAPMRTDDSSNENEVMGDLRKPSITDNQPKSGLKLFKRDSNKSWKLFGNHPIKIPSTAANNLNRKSPAVKTKKASVATSTTALILENRPANLPPKSAKEEQHHKQLYEEMLKGAKKKEIKDLHKEIKKTKQQYQQENEIMSSLRIWKEEVVVNWDSMKNTRKVKDLWWNGLPSSVRGKVWRLAIGNDLRITPELFQIMKLNAQQKIAAQKYQEPVATLHDNESSLVVSKENTVGLIALDVARTFPTLCIFQKGGPYHESLKNLLGAYTCYRPDVGYVQGMSFIAAMLLLNMDLIDAFICFANLMHKPCQMAFFMVNQPMMEAYFNSFDVMLEECCPRIHQHFRQQKLSHDIYLIDWIFTIYSKSLPLDIACRVWDLFCRDGEAFLFRTAIGILNLNQDLLLSLDFFRLAQHLTKLSHDVQIEKLFESIASVSFSSQRFHQVLNFYTSHVPALDKTS
eukprot:gene5458-6141_t